MLRLFSIFFSCFLGAFLFSSPVFAGTFGTNVLTGLGTIGASAGYQPLPLGVVVGGVLKMILGILGVIFLVMIVYGGFLWLTSAGEEKKTTEAMNLLSQAVVGLAITVVAYAITVFVINALSGI